jgi:hypothetical protein
MADEAQENPISRLMELGKPIDTHGQAWPDYLSLGIGNEHISALLEIATDAELINIPDEDAARGWAPVHAWRALGQLRAKEAIDPLICLFHGIRDNDWVIEEMPGVFAQIGPAAFLPLASYLRNGAFPTYSRLIAATAIKQMALSHPLVRDQAVDALAEQLRGFKQNSPGVNSVLIANLVDLAAIEHADLIHRTFAEGPVDRFLAGDWRDVKKKLRTSATATTQENITKCPGGSSATNEPPTRPAYQEPRTRPRMY